MANSPSPLLRVAALLGVLALAVGEWWLSVSWFPEIGFWHLAGNITAAHVLVFLVLLAGQSLIENLVVIAMISALGLISLFSTGDQLNDTARLLVWSLLMAVWYLPVFVVSLAGCFPRHDSAS